MLRLIWLLVQIFTAASLLNSRQAGSQSSEPNVTATESEGVAPPNYTTLQVWSWQICCSALTGASQYEVQGSHNDWDVKWHLLLRAFAE